MGLNSNSCVVVPLIPSSCAEGQCLLGPTAERERETEREMGVDKFISLYLFLYAVLDMSVQLIMCHEMVLRNAYGAAF